MSSRERERERERAPVTLSCTYSYVRTNVRTYVVACEFATRHTGARQTHTHTHTHTHGIQLAPAKTCLSIRTFVQSCFKELATLGDCIQEENTSSMHAYRPRNMLRKRRRRGFLAAAGAYPSFSLSSSISAHSSVGLLLPHVLASASAYAAAVGLAVRNYGPHIGMCTYVYPSNNPTYLGFCFSSYLRVYTHIQTSSFTLLLGRIECI